MGNHEEKEKKEENEEQKNQVVKELKVILIGNAGVGKTSLMNGANGITFIEGTQISTLVCSYVKVFLTISGKEYCINLWDTVGQERFRSLTNAFLNGANIIIFVFDITNEKSFTDLDFWFKYIEDELGPDIAKGIIANKQDLIEEQKVEDEIIENYAKENSIDTFTLEDIIKCLKQPNRDFRDDFQKPLLKSNILTLQDLREGMQLEGTVRNVVDFGAFIDIGLHDDGLAHISKLTKEYIKHPLDVVNVGDIVTCYVDKIDMNRQKVNLSLIPPESV